MEPILNQASTILKNFNVKIGKVDTTVETQLRDKFNVTGFPTLFTLNNGIPEKYTGGRTINSIIEYCSRNVSKSKYNHSRDIG